MSSNDQNQILLLLLLLFLAVPRFASAGMEFVSTPSSLRSPAGGTVLFEDTRFRFSSDKKPVSFYFSGSTFQPWQEDRMDGPDAALDYAYIGLPRILGTDLSLGRLRTGTGESLDGLYLRTRLTDSSHLSFFNGRSIESANNLMGGRFSWSDGRSRLGISYVSEPSGFREETAIDLRLHPFGKLTLSGASRLDLRTGNWTEHSYSARVGPFRKATLLFNASLLDVGTASTEPGSSDHALTTGAGIRYSLSKRLTVGFDVRRAADPFAGTTFSKEARISCSPFPSWSAGISVAQHEGENLDIIEINAHASKKTGPLEAFLNIRNIVQDRFSGSSGNFVALGLAYELSPAYRLVADIQRTRNSQLDVRSFIKLEYRFGS